MFIRLLKTTEKKTHELKKSIHDIDKKFCQE